MLDKKVIWGLPMSIGLAMSIAGLASLIGIVSTVQEWRYKLRAYKPEGRVQRVTANPYSATHRW